MLLAGPLDATGEVLLIIRADDPEEITARLAEDPWHCDLSRIDRIVLWWLRLGSLG